MRLLRIGLAAFALLAVAYAARHQVTITSPNDEPDRALNSYEFNEAAAGNRLLLREGGIHDMADAIKPGQQDASDCAT